MPNQSLNAGLGQIQTVRKKRLLNDLIVDDPFTAKLPEKVLDTLYIRTFKIKGPGNRGGKLDGLPQNKALSSAGAEGAVATA